MPSFQITLTPNRRAASRFVGQVRRALQKAYVEEQKKNGLSQSDIARALKVHRSVINRELRGLKDMTLGRVGELSWAMGRSPIFSIDESVQTQGTNLPVIQGCARPVINTSPAANRATSQPVPGAIPMMVAS
jgi:hypothetical protein